MKAGRYIALVRGINVGRAKRVSMSDLRELVEGLGYEDVRTLLNSGNVVFAADAAAARGAAGRIEKALAEQIGVPARVLVLTAVDMAAIVSGNPLLEVATNPSRLMVWVLFNASDCQKLMPLAQEDWAPEALAVSPRAAYLWCPDGVRESPASQALARALGDRVTTRNWATVQKLHALVQG